MTSEQRGATSLTIHPSVSVYVRACVCVCVCVCVWILGDGWEDTGLFDSDALLECASLRFGNVGDVSKMRSELLPAVRKEYQAYRRRLEAYKLNQNVNKGKQLLRDFGGKALQALELGSGVASGLFQQQHAGDPAAGGAGGATEGEAAGLEGGRQEREGDKTKVETRAQLQAPIGSSSAGNGAATRYASSRCICSACLAALLCCLAC
jgi:hypothetical protein